MPWFAGGPDWGGPKPRPALPQLAEQDPGAEQVELLFIGGLGKRFPFLVSTSTVLKWEEVFCFLFFYFIFQTKYGMPVKACLFRSLPRATQLAY